jgi:hypothetical protein
MSQIPLILPRFGAVPLAAIRQPDLQAWVAELSGRGFKPATVVKAYQLLGRTMTAAVNADMVPRSPCRAVRLPRVRHTAVALWIAAGANPKEVSVRAGHTSVAFTLDRYGHLFEATTTSCANAWTSCTSGTPGHSRRDGGGAAGGPGAAPRGPARPTADQATKKARHGSGPGLG